MAKKSATNKLPNMAPLLRVVGRDLGAAQQVQQAALHLPPTVVVQPLAAAAQHDYTQIDPALTIIPSEQLESIPHVGMGYAGFTPQQRYHFLAWTLTVEMPAPAAFHQLYLANLEVNLFDEPSRAHAAKSALLALAQLPAWQAELALARTLLLACWLTQDGPGLSRWLASWSGPLPIVGIALGHLSLLHEKIDPQHVIQLASQWQLGQPLPTPALLQLRLASLATNLALEPLQYALAQQGAAACLPKAWRCTHRDLRLALPQPDLRLVVEALLREMLTAPTHARSTDHTATPAEANLPAGQPTASAPGSNNSWHLILEFGESRSDLFQFALQRAQELPGYVQMMDENRRMIHRVHFSKSELRRFWQLWDYVQSWSGTSVYLNGKALNKWEIYPYSPFMR